MGDAWHRAEDLIRAAGEDPDELVRRAADNVDRLRSDKATFPCPVCLVGRVDSKGTSCADCLRPNEATAPRTDALTALMVIRHLVDVSEFASYRQFKDRLIEILDETDAGTEGDRGTSEATAVAELKEHDAYVARLEYLVFAIMAWQPPWCVDCDAVRARHDGTLHHERDCDLWKEQKEAYELLGRTDCSKREYADEVIGKVGYELAGPEPRRERATVTPEMQRILDAASTWREREHKGLTTAAAREELAEAVDAWRKP